MLTLIMDRLEQEKNTLAYYNKQAQEHREFRGEGVSQYWAEELAYFQELLPRGTVLEIGCGTGNEAVLLKEMGYDYLGTDISEGMLSVAKSRCSDATFVCHDFRVPVESSEFDGILGFASLLHLEKDEIVPTLKTLRKQLRSGGVGLFTLKEGQGTEIDSKGRFYSYYSSEEITKKFVDAGFVVLDATLHQEKVHNFICVFVENP